MLVCEVWLARDFLARVGRPIDIPDCRHPATQCPPITEETRVTAYDIDPAVLAYADQHKAAVSADLDVLIQSYLTHRGQTDPTVAFVVLLDNAREVLTFDQACDALVVAAQRLAELAQS